MNNNFPLTLTSNASMKIFPGNVPGNYKTKLSTPLNLDGPWECTIMDVQLPYRWYNIEKDMHFSLSFFHSKFAYDLLPRPPDVFEEYYKQLQGLTTKCHIGTTEIMMVHKWKDFISISVQLSAGFYESVQVLLDILMAKIKSVDNEYPALKEFSKDFKFEYDSFTNRITFDFGDYETIILSDKAQNFGVFGMTASQKYNHRDDYPMWDYEHKRKTILPLRPSLRIFKSIFVYTDIIKDQIVGDTQVPLLGALPVIEKPGNQLYWAFKHPFYIPITKQFIDTIEIKMTDETGKTIMFKDGLAIVRLHIRKQRI
jgi:hypothetical protein